LPSVRLVQQTQVAVVVVAVKVVASTMPEQRVGLAL
jgi:hypothetical protein